jgi:hypothetical protein
VAALLLIAGCDAQGAATDQRSPRLASCETPETCRALFTRKLKRDVLVPRDDGLQITKGQVEWLSRIEGGAYARLDLRDPVKRRSVSYIARPLSTRFPVGACANDATERSITTPSGRVACYAHAGDQLSLQYTVGPVTYLLSTTDSTEPRGVSNLGTTVQWLSAIVDTYS